jgi:hypothetical protein
MSFFKFSHYSATMIAEGVEQADSEEQYIAAWQYLIDTGWAWQLQGSFGRTAMALINDGICEAPARNGV